MNDESKIVALGANARMYAVNAQVAALWERLFAWIAEDADVPLAIVEHPAPQPLPSLWRRSDLGCAFICGYPLGTWEDADDRPRILAVPLPSPARYDGRPVYCTDIVVRRDSPHTDVDSLRGARFGYTVEHSQSGWHAPRAHLATRALAAGGRWLGEVVGPLVTPRAVIDAVLAGRVDAGPLDSWWHDLLRTHEPAVAATLRTVGSTPMTPIPPLVCAAATPHAQRERLAASLARAGIDPALRDLRDALLLRGFVRLAADDYRTLGREARRIDALGYPRLQ
jgi:ABC-type phosphate/phosphonate transport system substrate-binding protein